MTEKEEKEEKDAMKKFLFMLISKNQEEISKTLIKMKYEQIKQKTISLDK